MSDKLFEIHRGILSKIKNTPEYNGVVYAMSNKSGKYSKVDFNLSPEIKSYVEKLKKVTGLNYIDFALFYFMDEQIVLNTQNGETYNKTYAAINSYHSNLIQASSLLAEYSTKRIPLKNKRFDITSPQYKSYKEAEDTISKLYELIEKSTDLLFGKATVDSTNNKYNKIVKDKLDIATYPYDAKISLSIDKAVHRAIQALSKKFEIPIKHILYHSLLSLVIYERKNLLSYPKYMNQETKQELVEAIKIIRNGAIDFNSTIKQFHQANMDGEFDNYEVEELKETLLSLVKQYNQINKLLKGVINKETNNR